MKAIETLEQKLKELQYQLEKINANIEIFEQEIKKIKEHKKDEKLHLLHIELDNNGLKDRFQLLENDDDDDNYVIYYAYDSINPEIRYEINVTDHYDRWYFTIKLRDIRQGVFEIERKIMSFEHFIEYMVKPFLREVRYDI